MDFDSGVRKFDITGGFSRYLCSNGDLDEDGEFIGNE